MGGKTVMMFAKRNLRWKAVGRVQKFCGFMWLVDGVPTQTLPADKMGEGERLEVR